jgi:hypothetical protein
MPLGNVRTASKQFKALQIPEFHVLLREVGVQAAGQAK